MNRAQVFVLSLVIVSHTGFAATGDAIAPDIVAKVDPSVVAIQHERAVGSGFILSADGLILTNGHVVIGNDDEDPTKPARQIMVILSDERKYPATVLGFSMDPDVALIRIQPGAPLPPVEFADSRSARTGQGCFAVGTPVGLKRTFTSGVLSNVERTDLNTEVKVFQTDAAINPGNSGGPLFDLEGRVLGINTYASRGSNNLGFTIPSHVVLAVKDSLLKHGRLVRSMIPSVTFSELYDELAAGLGISKGVLIEHVEPDSPADRAGLRPGSVVTAINGAAVNARTRAHLLDLDWDLTIQPPGTPLTLTVQTPGRQDQHDLTLKLAEVEPLPRYGLHAGELVEFRLDALGLGVRPLVLIQRWIANLGDEPGVIVSTVARNSASASAGLEPRDVITHVGGVPTPDLTTFRRVLEDQLQKRPTVIEITFVRGRSRQDTALKPAYDLAGLTVGAHWGPQPPEFADLMRLELVASGCVWSTLPTGQNQGASQADLPDVLLLASEPGSAPDSDGFHDVVRRALEGKRVVAASGPAVGHILGCGADLDGRKLTFSKELSGRFPAGSFRYTGAEVERDGRMITSTGRDRGVVREFLKAVRKAAADIP